VFIMIDYKQGAGQKRRLTIDYDATREAAGGVRVGPGPAAPDHGPQTPNSQTQAPPWGSIHLGPVEEMLARLENCFDDLSTRDYHRVATSWFEDLLAMEVPASDRATGKGPGVN
jgi:hypothetical protein